MYFHSDTNWIVECNYCWLSQGSYRFSVSGFTDFYWPFSRLFTDPNVHFPSCVTDIITHISGEAQCIFTSAKRNSPQTHQNYNSASDFLLASTWYLLIDIHTSDAAGGGAIFSKGIFQVVCLWLKWDYPHTRWAASRNNPDALLCRRRHDFFESSYQMCTKKFLLFQISGIF